MSTRSLVFLDSGVGGLSFIPSLLSRSTAHPMHYVADNAYFPYGEQLSRVLPQRIEDLVATIWQRWQPALLVLACNTASVLGLSSLRAAFPQLSVVGVVPAIKPATSEGKSTAILATSLTSQHHYIADLLNKFAEDMPVVRIAAPELVRVIEKQAPYWDNPAILDALQPIIGQLKKEKIQNLVLGCTHFFHLAPILSQLLPNVICHDAIAGVAEQVQRLVKDLPSSQASLSIYCTALSEQKKWKTVAAAFSGRFLGLL